MLRHGAAGTRADSVGVMHVIEPLANDDPLPTKLARRLQQTGLLRTLRYAFVNLMLFRVVKTLFRFLPKWPWFDKALAKFNFWVFHWRLPSQRDTFNDAFFRVVGTDEIVDPLRVFVSDKEYVKLYVRAMVGEAHNIPTLAVLRSFEEVQRYGFPRDCVIKPTHGSGQVLFRRNGSPVDLEEIQRWFGMNYYEVAERQRNYRHLKPKVIVEPFVYGQENPSDYKIFCVRGVPKMLVVDVDRFGEHMVKYYDAQWRPQPFSLALPQYPGDVARPRNLDEMLRVAAAVSSHLSVVRIDLYTDGERCCVGEITNCHANATYRFIPDEGEQIAAALMFGPPDPLLAESLGLSPSSGPARGAPDRDKLTEVA